MEVWLVIGVVEAMIDDQLVTRLLKHERVSEIKLQICLTIYARESLETG